MVDVLGHFGMALMWALPAWFIWDGRVSLAMVALTLTTAMLPDVDLVLRDVMAVHHHGVTHTVVFVLTVALIAGALVEYGFGSFLKRKWLKAKGYTVSKGALFVFIAGGFTLGGFSHIFADMLSAPDISTPIEPLWPLIDKPWSIDVIWYANPWWNEGLLIVAVLLHIAAAYLDVHVEHPFRIERSA